MKKRQATPLWVDSIATVCTLHCQRCQSHQLRKLREKRKESYNEAGKAVHEFIRGVVGSDKTEKKETK